VTNRTEAGDGGSGSRGIVGAGLGAGGAIFCEGGTANISDSTISRNVTQGGNNGALVDRNQGSLAYGGGIYVGTAQVVIANSTIVSNMAIGGAGVVILATNVQGSGLGGGVANQQGIVIMGSTIVWGNAALYPASSYSNYPDVWGSYLGLSRNLIGVTNGSSGWSTQDLIGVDPKLGPLLQNGGPTLSHALLTGSPAIDAGTNFGLSSDQRGQARTVEVPSVPDLAGSDGTDIGALELDPVLRVTGIQVSNSDIFISFTSTSDQSYDVQYKTESTSAIWTNLGGTTRGSGGIVTAKDAGAASQSARFYRVRTQ
jgi:hypothetical protein